MPINKVAMKREGIEDIFDLDIKEIADTSPVSAVPAPKNTNETCSISVVCCCCSA